MISEKDKGILDRARSRWTEGMTAEKYNRERGLESLRFKVGDQWDDDVQRDRISTGVAVGVHGRSCHHCVFHHPLICILENP